MKKLFKRVGYAILIIFILMNVIAVFHAYKFTHLVESNEPRQKEFNGLQKAKVAWFGINNPRPVNDTFPTQHYETIKIKSNKS